MIGFNIDIGYFPGFYTELTVFNWEISLTLGLYVLSFAILHKKNQRWNEAYRFFCCRKKKR